MRIEGHLQNGAVRVPEIDMDLTEVNGDVVIADGVLTGTGLLAKLDAGNVDLAADIASIPEHIRGFGHVKEAHLHKAKTRQAELLKEWDNPLRVVQV